MLDEIMQGIVPSLNSAQIPRAEVTLSKPVPPTVETGLAKSEISPFAETIDNFRTVEQNSQQVVDNLVTAAFSQAINSAL